MNDVRLAARSLRRSPGFLAVALVTMAIGIGVSTALFSVVDGVLLRPLPYPHAERLVALYTTNVARHQTTGAVSYADFADWRAQSRSFDAMAAYHASGAVLGGPEPQHVPAARVSASFFDVFAVAPARGRAFSSEADARAEKVAVVTHAFWQRRMNADDSAVGRAMTLDGEPFTVVGILPAAFKPPAGVREAQIFLPLSPDGTGGQNRGGRYLNVAARLRAEATTGQALTIKDLDQMRKTLKMGVDVMKPEEARLISAIHDLPIEYRQVITLTLEGMSYTEIAEILGIGESNVGVRLNRARQMLRRRLEVPDER